MQSRKTDPAETRLRPDEPFFHGRWSDNRTKTRGEPDCSLGHRVQRSGDGKPDGIFAAWHWDGQRLRVENDRYGAYPLYCFVRENEICIAPSVLAILAEVVPAADCDGFLEEELDTSALAVFLRLGYFLGESTPFRSIRALPPDAELVWEAGRMKVTGGVVKGTASSISRDDAIDGYLELFREAIRKRLPQSERVAMPLSGGQDSRHILLELCRQEAKPAFCVTTSKYPPHTGVDEQIASVVAVALGVKHKVIARPEPWFEAECRKNVETSFCTDEGAWLLGLRDFLRGQVDVAYDGIGGDSFAADHFLTDEKVRLFERGEIGKLARMILAEGLGDTCGIVNYLLHPKWQGLMTQEVALQEIETALAKYQDFPNPSSAFYFWERTRREITLSPWALMRDIPTFFAPFLDHDLFDFVTSLPPSRILDKRFHIEAIRRGYPRYACLPFDEEMPPQQRALGGPHFERMFRDLLAYLLRNPRRSFPMVRTRWLLPRLAASRFSRKYCSGAVWMANAMTIYMVQFERLGRILSECKR